MDTHLNGDFDVDISYRDSKTKYADSLGRKLKPRRDCAVRAIAQYRREIAQLKRQHRDLEKKVAQLEVQRGKQFASTKPVTETNSDARFSARSVKAQRSRIGLSAAEYAKLVQVSPLTIYNWEHNKSRPRKEQFAALIALRGIGKREARAKLAQLALAENKSNLRRRSRRRKAA